MNPFWSMSASSVRKRSDGEEKALAGDVITSPPRAAPKKQLPCIPKNALPITKPTSPAPAAQSANGTHASYGPFYLEYSLLAEFTLVVKQKLPGVYVQPSYRSALSKEESLLISSILVPLTQTWALAVHFSPQCGLESYSYGTDYIKTVCLSLQFTSLTTTQMVTAPAWCLIFPSFTH